MPFYMESKMILPTSKDRYILKINDITLKIAPLSFEAKQKIGELEMREGGVVFEDTLRGLKIIIQYMVKEIEGVKRPNGEIYELEFEDNILTEECVGDLLNLNLREIPVSFWQINEEIPKTIKDPITGKKLKGVSIKYEESGVKK